jgi:hypothetical protein
MVPSFLVGTGFENPFTARVMAGAIALKLALNAGNAYFSGL